MEAVGFNWDDEDVQATGGDFIKFDHIGDSVVGTITAIRKQRFEDKDGVSYAPQIDLNTEDGERTLTAGALKLRQLFLEQRPEVGDRIKVVHNGMKGRVKLFTLQVKRDEMRVTHNDKSEAAPAKPAKKAVKANATLDSMRKGDGFSDSDDGIPF